MCRYKEPKAPNDELTLVLYTNEIFEVDMMQIQKLQRVTYIYFSKFKFHITLILQCNTNLKFVYSSKLGYYWAAYATKQNWNLNKKIWQLLTILKKFASSKKSLFRSTIRPKIHQNLTSIQIFLRIKKAWALWRELFLKRRKNTRSVLRWRRLIF